MHLSACPSAQGSKKKTIEADQQHIKHDNNENNAHAYIDLICNSFGVAFVKTRHVLKVLCIQSR